MKGKRTAIIIHGGAIKGVFAAGAVYELSKVGIQTADMIVGTSSSVPTAAYLASQQFEFMRKIWVEEVGSKDFIDYGRLFTGKPIFDLRYLIDIVFGEKYPLDIQRIIRSNAIFTIPLYNYREGRTEFFSNRQEEFIKNFWKILQAAITVHDRHIDWGGSLEKFVDADLDPFAFYRQEIIPKDWNVIVIINHKQLERTLKRWAGVRIFRLLQSRHFPDGVKAKLKIRGELIDSGVELFENFRKEYQPVIVSPPSTMKLATRTLIIRDKNRLNDLFENGREVVVNMMEDVDTKKQFEVFISRSQELMDLSENDCSRLI